MRSLFRRLPLTTDTTCSVYDRSLLRAQEQVNSEIRRRRVQMMRFVGRG